MNTTANVFENNRSLSERPQDDPGYLRRLARMAHGLYRPRSLRERKEALIEVQRLSAPVAALLVPLLLVALLALISGHSEPREPITVLNVREPEGTPPLVDPPEPTPPEATESPDAAPDLPSFAFATPAIQPLDNEILPVPAPQNVPKLLSASPAENERTVAVCAFPLPPGYGSNRLENTRKKILIENDGTSETEAAVLRALRWLKKNQQADGAWKNQRVAMTGLATLTFLAHGETPGNSAEFGDTVRRALEFLLASQKEDGHFRGADGNEYAHPIATYALCEAYGMTLNPNLKTAAERALLPIIAGQHPTGGWTYKMDPRADSATGRYRDDTSYMGWCAQAIKAAQLAQLKVEGLARAGKLAVRGFQANAAPDGGFGYTSPGRGGLTGVGTLCLQLLGAAGENETQQALALMDRWLPAFGAQQAAGNSPQYYCYYATQCAFHAGGTRWTRWNEAMKPLYLGAQQIEKAAALDAEGHAVDIGWWTNGDAHTDRPVMDTCLAALQLMVYYRSLPTTVHAMQDTSAPVPPDATDKDDLPLYVSSVF